MPEVILLCAVPGPVLIKTEEGKGHTSPGGLDTVYGPSIPLRTLPLSVHICRFMGLAILFRYHVLISWMAICNKGKRAVVQCPLNSTFVGKIAVTLGKGNGGEKKKQ